MTEKQKAKQKKMFVLDTSVILYDHSAVEHFGPHDVAIPITVLEELDNFKKGNDTKNFEAREFIRLIDRLAKDGMLHQWNPINGKGKGFQLLIKSIQFLCKRTVMIECLFGRHQVANPGLEFLN